MLEAPIPRLLTLTGPGGCGKTRLALALAEQCAEPVFLVELASVSDAALVPRAVAAALGVREQSERPLPLMLAQALADRPTLLVLDNCEHLSAACAILVDDLLGACAGLRVLATSREPLAVHGEQTWQVPPLGLPESTADDPARAAAVRLFVERARAARRTFVLDMGNAGAVATLCRRLDGLPLAIELAAARVNVLGVDQILDRLASGDDVLERRQYGTSPRQHTLQATIDWSYGLLGDVERELLCRLAVFAAGWSLEAASALHGGDALEPLTRLVDKSLVQVEERRGQARYQLLETIRQYAASRLTGSGVDQTTRARHAHFFAQLARTAADGLLRTAPATWMAALQTDHDNLRVALSWLAEHEPPAAQRMAADLWWFWFRGGLWREGRAWLEPLTRAALASDPEALLGLGVLAWAQGDHALAQASLEASIAHEADPVRETSGLALQFLAMELLAQGHLERSRAPIDEAVRRLRALGSTIGLGFTLASQGVVDLAQHDLAAARAALEESVAVLRAHDDAWGVALPLRNLGIVAFQSGDLARAEALVRQSLAALEAQPDPWFVSRSLETLATIAAARGQHARAARLFGAGEALRVTVGAAVLPFYQRDYAQGTAGARAALGEAAFAHAWAEGRALRLDQALTYARAAEQPVTPALSQRESEVLGLLARGLSNRAIAEALVVTEKTAEAHVSAILRKLDLSSRAQAAVWAVEHRPANDQGHD